MCKIDPTSQCPYSTRLIQNYKSKMEIVILFLETHVKVCRMMAKCRFAVISFLDDFLRIQEDQITANHLAYHTMWCLLVALGFTINKSKAYLSNQIMVIFGIEINNITCTLAHVMESCKYYKLNCQTAGIEKKTTKGNYNS